jgi:hypothetical protein
MTQNPRIPHGQPLSSGPSTLRVYNPVRDTALVILSKDGCTGSFYVDRGQTTSHQVSTGRRQIYFIYDDEPEMLYQGDDVTLNNQIGTIILQLVPQGNYNIRRVQ